MLLRRSHVATALAVLALGGTGVAQSGAGTGGYRVLLASNRDGVFRGYSVRADGSGLAPILARSRPLVPTEVSGDGNVVAYGDRDLGYGSGISVSRADGRMLRRVAGPDAREPALSRDGRLLAFIIELKPGIWIVGTDGRGRRRLTRGDDSSPVWSPDGKSVVFLRSIGDFAETAIVRPLHGAGREVAWADFGGLAWSPDGRWIAYLNDVEKRSQAGLWVVRRDGTGRHRITSRAGVAFAWSPDGTRIAAVRGKGAVILDLRGRATALRLPAMDVSELAWSPDSRRLAVAGGFPQKVFVVGADGRGLRRVASEGDNRLVGWTRLAPALPPARPIPPTEHVTGARTLAVRGHVSEIAADGARVAFVVESTRTDCHHVALWTPSTRSVLRFAPQAPCEDLGNREGLGGVALAGGRVAWEHATGGNTLEQYVLVNGVEAGSAYAFGDETYGTFLGRVAGDGSLLAFAIEHRCSAYETGEDACPAGYKDGAVTKSTVYGIRAPSRRATPIVTAAGPLDVLAVNDGRVVVATQTDTRILGDDGHLVRTLPVAAESAALSGDRLAVESDAGVSVYAVSTGTLLERFPALGDLQDLEGDLLVTASAGSVEVQRLTDRRTLTISADGDFHAQLEAPGLFVASRGGIRFTPMRDLLRRLGR